VQKEKDKNTDEFLPASFEFNFFRVQLKLAFRIRPRVLFFWLLAFLWRTSNLSIESFYLLTVTFDFWKIFQKFSFILLWAVL